MEVERSQHVIGEDVLGLGLQQVFQVLTRVAAVTVPFLGQRLQEAMIDVSVAQEKPTLGTKLVAVRRPHGRSGNSA